MKKISILTLALVGLSAATIFTGCGKDEAKPKPTISVEKPTGGAEVTAGTSYDIKFTASADAELKTVLVKVKNGQSDAVTLLDSTFSSGKNTFTYDKANVAGAAGTEVITITVTDRDNIAETSTITLTVKASAGEINSYTAKLLGGQLNPNAGSFFATTNGTVYKSADAKTNQTLIDFVYFFGDANAATIAAPSDADANTAHQGNSSLSTWTTKNNTKFKTTTVTATEFDASQNDALITANGSDINGTKANNLSAGNVIAFQTEAGKKGLFKVVAVTGTGGADRAITIDVKVQK